MPTFTFLVSVGMKLPEPTAPLCQKQLDKHAMKIDAAHKAVSGLKLALGMHIIDVSALAAA